ncbi:hypothetical protein NI374_20865 [Vibrio parahaemolyticus]|nr:hypothetical protein NI374_20865 [Vibrio parahaemolyticus]
MAPVFFLTQQAALPSRKVLRKVIQFATALAQPIVVLVEDHRRSEDHAFAHFLSFNSDHIEKRQAEFEAWTSKFKDFVIELCEEEEVETPTLSYEHFKGSHWIAQVAKRLVDDTDLLLAGHFNKHDIQTLLTELAKNDCDLLLLSERSWPSHANMLCAIDPLHRGDAKSVVDKAIVSRGSKLEKP